jgi:hypothetical protein
VASKWHFYRSLKVSLRLFGTCHRDLVTVRQMIHRLSPQAISLFIAGTHPQSRSTSRALSTKCIHRFFPRSTRGRPVSRNGIADKVYRVSVLSDLFITTNTLSPSGYYMHPPPISRHQGTHTKSLDCKKTRRPPRSRRFTSPYVIYAMLQKFQLIYIYSLACTKISPRHKSGQRRPRQVC